MPVSQYPSAGDYQAALQSPANAFTDSRLQQAEFALDNWGLPDAITGTSAAVFHATIEGRGYALRCYTRSDASSRERYAAFDSFVAQHGLGQHVGLVTWYDDAVQVKSGTWPVLQMEWIEGRRLNDYVSFLADDRNTGALGTLADRWLELIGQLQRTRFAHGDLQHGNVIIDQQGSLRLVDFDGVWIPPLQGHSAPNETGHENYQPLNRSAQTRWGPWMDTFSALVIHLALTALARDPGLWLPLSNGDNMLFERNDFGAPFETEVWKHLARVRDAEVVSLVEKLEAFCAPGWLPAKGLNDVIRPNWWDQPGASPAPRAKAGPAPVNSAEPVPSTGAQAARPTPSTRTSISLPPPPTWAYQAKVAPPPPPQRPGPTQSGTGAQSSVAAMAAGQSRPPLPVSKTGIPAWWQPQGPVKTAPAPPAKKSPAQAVGVICIIFGIVLFTVLLAIRQPAAAVVVCIAAVSTGIGIIKSRPPKRPGQLPPGGKSSGGT